MVHDDYYCNDYQLGKKFVSEIMEFGRQLLL